MVIGVLQFELLIPGAESLKDKRRVVSSLKDRLHREHLVSVAEVGAQDNARLARMGLALVAQDGKRAGQVLDQISAKLRQVREAELGDVTREIILGEGGNTETEEDDTRGSAQLDQEMRARAARVKEE